LAQAELSTKQSLALDQRPLKMKFQISFLFILALGSAISNQQGVTPVQKVLRLLQGMLEKGKKEKHAEQVMFAASRQFCGDTEENKVSAIKEEKQTIEGLTALIRKDRADAAHLLKLIGLLDADKDTWSGDIKAATKVRTIEKADYDAMHKDYSESIDAIGRAVQILKKQSHDRGQKKSFAQVSSLSKMSLIPEHAKKVIDAFLQQGVQESDLEAGAPEANGYEFQSAGLVDMLEKLQDKFIDERTAVEKKEANAKNAYSLLMQDLKNEIVQAVKDKHGKQIQRSARLQSKADEKGDRKDEKGIKGVDEKFLRDLKATCEMKSSDFQARQRLRAEEITTIEKAIEILSGSAVSGNAKKHLPGLVQKFGTSFSQLRSDANFISQANSKKQVNVAKFLHSQAMKLNSRVLAAVAQRAAEDPFTKVKKMIKDLVVRLMEEANEEAEHKGWCDTELSTNAQTRKEKTSAVESLQAEIDSLVASIAKLTEDVNELSKASAELAAAMAKSTKLRVAEKAANTETINDSQEAQTAVAQALIVLKEFYAKAAESTAFAQITPYKGMGAENGGVVGMLEVIESDFARLESETKAAEASASKEYDEFMTDSKVDKASKVTAQEHKAAKKQGETQALLSKKNDLTGTQKELDASLAYFDKLRPSCVDSGVSYEDRVNRRKEEIESLQEGLKVLNGEDLA